MCGVGICITLLTIMAALFLHYKTKGVSRYYRWATYFILGVASIVLILQITRGICGMCCHRGMCYRTEQCGPNMCRDGMYKDGMCKDVMGMKDGKGCTMMNKNCTHPMTGCSTDSTTNKNMQKPVEEKKDTK